MMSIKRTLRTGKLKMEAVSVKSKNEFDEKLSILKDNIFGPVNGTSPRNLGQPFLVWLDSQADNIKDVARIMQQQQQHLDTREKYDEYMAKIKDAGLKKGLGNLKRTREN